MKKLLSLAILSLAILIPSTSFANVNVFGVETPVAKNEVRDSFKGGQVETDFISFYIRSNDEAVESGNKVSNTVSVEESIMVFGVKIPAADKS